MVMLKYNIYIKEKARIREKILNRLRSQDREGRDANSQKIKRRLFKDKSFQAAKTIMVYVSKEYEVNTKDIIEEALELGKKVVVPVTEIQKKRLIPSEITDPKTQLEKGTFGVYEPKKECIKAVRKKDIDMVIVPGIAFDKKGNRIGHGVGYFDRFLKNLPKDIPTIGLAFSFQLVHRIKTLAWDIPVTKVITA